MTKRVMSKQDVDTIYLSLAALVSIIHPIIILMVGAAWLWMWFFIYRKEPKNEQRN